MGMRSFWSLGGLSRSNLFKSNDLGTVEKAAEEEPDNPRKQAAFYRVIFADIIGHLFIVVLDVD